MDIRYRKNKDWHCVRVDRESTVLNTVHEDNLKIDIEQKISEYIQNNNICSTINTYIDIVDIDYKNNDAHEYCYVYFAIIKDEK